VLKVIQQLGLSPAETTLFSEERVIEHYEKVSGNLSIHVSIFVYQKGEDCYFSSEDSMDTYHYGSEDPPVPFKLFDQEVVYDRVYFPTLTKETKGNGLFSRKEWMSYFVMAR
jgi:hypothetical protein